MTTNYGLNRHEGARSDRLLDASRHLKAAADRKSPIHWPGRS